MFHTSRTHLSILLFLAIVLPVQAEAPKDIKQLQALQSKVQAVAKKVIPCTVGLQMGGGAGSGVIISKDGYVLTAGHVSGAAGRDVNILLSDGRMLKGKTLGANRSIDSGLIKINGDGPFPHVEMGKSGELKAGQWCIATGHPGGYQIGRTPVVRLGRVQRNTKSAVVTDCTLIGGDSGGPLFDLDGKVIGINSRIAGSLAANVHVPVDTFHETWDRLAKGEVWGSMGGGGPRVGGPFLGVGSAPNSNEARIGNVVQGSPADKAGIKPGDIVKKFGGKPVKQFSDLVALVQKRKPGQKVKVEVLRGEETVKLDLTIGRYGRPRRPERPE